MPIIFANNINIYYETHGKKGDYLILIGGLTRDHTIWRHVVEPLSKNFQVIIFDNRGAGKSDKPEGAYSIEMLSEDLSGLITALGIKQAHIVGHSMGGFMAMRFAAKFPEKVKKLVLCSVCVKQVTRGIEYLKNRIALVSQVEKSQLFTATTASAVDIRNAMSWLYAKAFLANAEKVAAVLEHETKNRNPQPGYAFKCQAIACLEHDVTDILPNLQKIGSNILVVSGEEDMIITPEVSQILIDSIPGSISHIMTDVGHMVQIENPTAFINLLDAFFLNKLSHITNLNSAAAAWKPIQSRL